MEPWFKLLLQWAIPVFKTLVSLRNTNLQREIPTDLDKRLPKIQMMLQPLEVTHPIEPENNRQAVQKQLAELGYQLASELPEFIQSLTKTTDSSSLEVERWQFEQQKALQQQLVAYNRETLLKVAAYQRETTLQLPEVNKILDRWPLRLFPSQLLDSRPLDQPIPLRILIAPPQIPFDRFGEINSRTPNLELGLAQKLREFLSQNYSLLSPTRPTEFLGGAWESESFHGEASIKALFGMLKSEPILILESEIEGDDLTFRMAYWGLGQDTYCYATIFKFSYREFVYESAKCRAIRWQETSEKLLALGKNIEEVNRLGGDNAVNLAILKETMELQQAGIDLSELTFPYQVTAKDWDNLCQFLSTCHCIVAGWVSDIYHLVHHDISPLLPELLPQLVADISEPQLVQAVIQTTIAIYQGVLKSLVSERPCWEPELALKLAQSLTHLPNQSWARDQIDYSIKCWLQQRQLPELEGIEALAAMESVLTVQDQDYCETLLLCLSALGDDQGVAQVQELLQRLAKLSVGISAFKCQPPLTNLSLTHTFTQLSGKVGAIAISPDGQTFFSCGDDSTIKQWDLTGSHLTPIHQFIGHSGGVLTLTLSHDGQLLASSDTSKHRSYIKIWNLQTGKPLWTLSGHRKQIHTLALSSNGQTLASGSHKIKLWNLQTGEPFRTLFGHKEWVYSLAISPDSQILVSGSQDKTIKIWQLDTGKLLRTLNGHHDRIRAVAISPDQQTIASGSEDKTIKLWDFDTGKLLSTLTDHSGAIYAVAISPDGQHLVSGSADKTIKLWHLHTGELIQTLTGHHATVYALAISSDGRIIASGSEDKTIKIWRSV